jgi:hypothetical protein
MLLSGIALLYTAFVWAQAPTPQPPAPSAANTRQTVTLAGCVGTMSGPQGGFMLSNPVVVPPAGAAATTSTATPTAAATPTPAATPTATPIPAPTPAPPPTPQPAAPVGTAGTASTGATPAGTAPGSVAAGAGTNAAMSGYRLSGADMTSWSGQRVQIVGTIVPGPTTPAAAAPTGATNAGGMAPMPEFRVQSVQPIDGPCPK